MKQQPSRIPALLALGLAFAAGAAHAQDPFLRRTATVAAVEKVGPSVVNITTEQKVQVRNTFFDLFFEPNLRQRTAQSLGSGIVIDGSGRVLTNEHVVRGAETITVTLADGRELGAKLVGADPNNDIAVLQLEDASEVPWIAPGTSSGLFVGEPVIAIGNPFGFSNTVTTGVLSATDRSLRTPEKTYHGFLQTDASINPGNSGGPLLNAEGELIGINTAIYQGAEGIGFAIPIDVAKRIVHELVTKGTVAPVWLGLDLQDLEPAMLELLKLPAGQRGAIVNRVRAGGPGAKAGVLRGDVLMKIDAHGIRAAREFYEVLESSTAGQTHELQVLRGGRTITLRATAAEIPPAVVGELTTERLGVRLSFERGLFRVAEVRPGSGAEQIGLQPGDYVRSIDGQLLADEQALRRAVLRLQGRDSALIRVQRGRRLADVPLPLS
ncbi:MAG TPA: trypsin-like peptidase domain-containing protein [Myxococcota bacterium]|nr:trypsin-like peptidase domain-containing protein [Myxococcota bacterium]